MSAIESQQQAAAPSSASPRSSISRKTSTGQHGWAHDIEDPPPPGRRRPATPDGLPHGE